MANIELRKRFFGEGVVGSIDLPSVPTLSWSEHHALVRSATELRWARSALEDLGLDVRSIARAIGGLEGELGLILDQQTMLLDQQVSLLADIAQSLRSPARVRAAERLSSVGELLRRGRYDRALAAAEQAIEDDPNNPAGFVAAGWAHIGLERLEQARSGFNEAALASDGDASSIRVRQAARLTLALEGAQAALDRLSEGTGDPQSAGEHAAVAYDRSVYLAELGDTAPAQKSLLEAGRDEPSFLFAAFADPLLASHQTILDAASREIKTRQRRTAEQTAEYEDLIRRLGESVVGLQDAERTLLTAGKDERQQIVRELTATAKSNAEEHTEQIALAQRTLQTGHLATALHELQQALKRAAAYEAEMLTPAVRALALERAVLDFATREDALPMKLKDGTWDITKHRRFGHRFQWRAMVDEHGEPVIESVNQ